MIKLKSLFRRGPSGPSSSKQQQQQAAAAAASTSGRSALNPNPTPTPQLKGASSVSSLDHVGIAAKSSGKPHKHHGSKDRLIDAKLSKGSREKLAASRESLDVKESKHQQRQQRAELQQQLQLQQQQQQQLQRPMSLVQQQQHVSGNNNLIDGGGYAGMVDPLTKELTDINFDGPREVDKQFNMFLISIIIPFSSCILRAPANRPECKSCNRISND